MKLRPMPSAMLVLALSVASGLVAGCSKKDKGTNPIPVTEPFESGDLSNSGPTSIFVHIFNTVGSSFTYHCRHHAMTGSVSVAAGGSDSVTVPIGDNFFGTPTQGTLPVRPGGYVKWVNSGVAHTVTRP